MSETELINMGLNVLIVYGIWFINLIRKEWRYWMKNE